jgi:hypothetical protein
MTPTTTTNHAPPSISPPTHAQGPVPAAPVLALPRNRKNPLLIAAAVLLVLLGGLGAWFGVQQTGTRTGVVGVARDVTFGQVLTARDLVQVDVTPDPGLATVPWGSVAVVVGQRAATDLVRGSLLTPRSTTAGALTGVGEAVVGVTVKPSQAPTMELHARDRVQVVVQPAAEAGPVTLDSPFDGVAGWVLAVGPVQSGGSRTIDIVVPTGKAAGAAALGAAGRLALVFLGRG